MQNTLADTLLEKIHLRTARVGVIGLGYVGLPLAIEFAQAGFPVLGFDLDAKKVESIQADPTSGISATNAFRPSAGEKTAMPPPTSPDSTSPTVF